jgi:hypothetical protein
MQKNVMCKKVQGYERFCLLLEQVYLRILLQSSEEIFPAVREREDGKCSVLVYMDKVLF